MGTVRGRIGTVDTHAGDIESTEATTPPVESAEVDNANTDEKAEVKDPAATEQPDAVAEGGDTPDKSPEADKDTQESEENPAPATDDTAPAESNAERGNNGK